MKTRFILIFLFFTTQNADAVRFPSVLMRKIASTVLYGAALTYDLPKICNFKTLRKNIFQSSSYKNYVTELPSWCSPYWPFKKIWQFIENYFITQKFVDELSSKFKKELMENIAQSSANILHSLSFLNARVEKQKQEVAEQQKFIEVLEQRIKDVDDILFDKTQTQEELLRLIENDKKDEIEKKNEYTKILADLKQTQESYIGLIESIQQKNKKKIEELEKLRICHQLD